jgi:hypothetical protein
MRIPCSVSTAAVTNSDLLGINNKFKIVKNKKSARKRQFLNLSLVA